MKSNSFELSMVYQYRANDLPIEQPTLIIVMTGERFYELKGIAESILDLLGAQMTGSRPVKNINHFIPERTFLLGDCGVVGEINQDLRVMLGIKTPVTILELDVAKIVADAKPQKHTSLSPNTRQAMRISRSSCRRRPRRVP